MNKTIDLMTGRACQRMDQLPVVASSENTQRIALVMAGAAFILAAAGLGVPAPRTGSNVATPIEVASTRIS